MGRVVSLRQSDGIAVEDTRSGTPERLVLGSSHGRKTTTGSSQPVRNKFKDYSAHRVALLGALALKNNQNAKFNEVRRRVLKVAQDRDIQLEKQSAALAGQETPYYRQGNLEFYTNASLCRRKALRSHPDVEQVLDRFWDTVQIARDSNDFIHKVNYLTIHYKMQKALAPYFRDDEARKSGEEDWLRDTKRVRFTSGVIYSFLL